MVAAVGLASRSGFAQRWQDATADCLGTTAGWTNDIELIDVDGDGLVDIVFANGGDYDTPGTPEVTSVFRNLGGWQTAGQSHCTNMTSAVFGTFTGLARTVRAGDIDGDGDQDLVVGGAYQTQLRMFRNDGGGVWSDVSAQLPQQLTSIGDAEFGDVDGDGDLDLLLGEWGPLAPGDPNYVGGRTRLYRNDSGTFVDVTTTAMPDLLVAWSWDVELVDVDNDWDLDALVSCKLCARSLLLRNDGSGHFTDDPTAIPAATNNYEFEAMDIDGDGDLDLATLNDGNNLRDRLLVNDGSGHFTDESATRLLDNPPADDNAVIWLDADSDGDADLMVAALGNDRLLVNDGSGHFRLAPNATPNDTRGSLAIAAVDLDGDGRLDLVQGQGEAAFADKVQRATDMIAIDSAPPAVTAAQVSGRVVARVHDHQSPSRAHDWKRVWAELTDGSQLELTWYGEYLWRADAAAPLVRVCAEDRRANRGCSDGATTGDQPIGGDGAPEPGGQGGCCGASQSPVGSIAPLALIAIGLLASRRATARSRSTPRYCDSSTRYRTSR